MTKQTVLSNATATMADLPPLATPRQVAEVCSVSERHVLRLCERGELKAVKLGRVWRINRDALAAKLGM